MLRWGKQGGWHRSNFPLMLLELLPWQKPVWKIKEKI
jgi:hypothetical protein